MRWLLTGALAAACAAGCTGSDPDPPPAAVEPAKQESFDLPGTVDRLTNALARERAIVMKYPARVGSGPPTLDAADRGPLWQAAQDELAALETIVRMSEAHPEWDATIAQWYDASIGPPLKETAAMLRQRGNLVGVAAGDEAAYRDYYDRRAAATRELLMIKGRVTYPGVAE